MIRRLVPLVLALGLAACNTSASYFQDEDDGGDGDTNAFGSLLTMSGMLAAPKQPIEYGARAPLAMPGTMDLPQPTDRSEAEAAVNFPVDQEQQTDAAIARLREGGAALDRRLDRDNGNARALPGEIQATAPAAPARTSDVRDLHNNVSERDRLTRSQMTVVVKDPNRTTLLNEDGTAAPRTTLVVPPSDYRTPVATAALPEPGDIENSDWIRKQLYQRDDRLPARMQGQPNAAARAPGSGPR